MDEQPEQPEEPRDGSRSASASGEPPQRRLEGYLALLRRSLEEEPPAPAPGLAPGRVVGDFRLVALLGQGGMGQVWEAEQLSMQRRVAVKFVRPERVTPRQLELFEREARAGGRLSHPGIVTVYGHGESDGLAWIAMELVSGAWTLKHLVEEVARAEEVPDGYDRHVARLVAEIGEAMQVAHDAGVIHRDLKPQNVLLTPNDHPKVMDFGLARITDETALSRTGDFAGTYAYMSPEQLAARRTGIDHRTDVFSLGIVLYELLALRRPFDGDTSHQVAAQILMKDPPDVRSVRSRVPRDLAVIAAKALEKDRDRRFQSAGELAADLRRHLADEPIHAQPPTRVERTVKWARRNPAKSAVAGIASVAFAVIAALLAVNVRTNRELSRERAQLADANLALSETAERERVAARLAVEERERADREARAAMSRADEVLRLSALQRLDDLVAEADRLWPAHPANVGRYEGWLERAALLAGELPDHEAKLAELRGRARTDPAEPLSWTFDEEEDRWWHGQLVKLVDGLRALADPETGLFSAGTSPEHGWGVERRLWNALELAEGFAPDGAHGRAWATALPGIGAAYPGVALAPQMGLVPLGPDPDSGLWEFAHLETGEPAARGADGRPVLTEATGLVLVLVPGGSFRMGAQRDDPEGPNHDPGARSDEAPVREVTLSPFFLSKYEMTQGQWQRFTGANPSYYEPGHVAGSLLHPVEQTSWLDGVRELGRLGLVLPTEAQWEYAARAGSDTVFWTGDERESLRGAANLADQAAARAGLTWHAILDWPDLDDGHAVHAPVGTYRPNPFGFHDAHGNVWEWCLDGYTDVYPARGPVTDPVSPSESLAARVIRGGAFDCAAVGVRSALRVADTPSNGDGAIGLRPARAVAR